MQISVNFLSKPTFAPFGPNPYFVWAPFRDQGRRTKNFLVGSSSLSPMVKKIGIIVSRLYSTHSVGSNIDEIGLNKKSLEFASLEEGYEEIKYKFIGVSGVYKLTNKNEPSRFYIGSSNNLARRMDEYIKLTKGLRNTQSSADLEISKTLAAE